MAMIPSKDKTKSFSTDSFDFTTMALLCITIILGSHVIGEFIHEKFEILGIVILLLVVGYLLFPNPLNEGRNGAQRILICLKFYKGKVILWLKR